MPDAAPVATPAAPEAALALHLLDRARRATSPVIAIFRSAPRLARVAALTRAMADGVEVLPPWDVLPYDRTLPSAAVVGQRMHGLTVLAQPARGPRPLPELSVLLDLARLRMACRHAGVARADLGLQGVALTPADPAAMLSLAARLGARVRGARAVLAWRERDPAAGAARVAGLLDG